MKAESLTFSLRDVYTNLLALKLTKVIFDQTPTNCHVKPI